MPALSLAAKNQPGPRRFGPFLDAPRPRLVAPGPSARILRSALDKHAVVFRAGDPATQLFEVIEDCVMVYLLLEDGRRQVVDLVWPGGICGFALDGAYPSTGEARQRFVVRAHAVSEAGLDAEFRDKLAAFAQRQICVLHQHAVILGRKSAQERVCSLLLRFAEACFGPGALEGAAPAGGWRLDAPMTRGEMGDYLGLSLETVCRTLSDLRQKSLIDIGRKQGQLRIRNIRHLRDAAGG